MKQITAFLLLFYSTLIIAQVPQNYFSDPIKIPMVLSGTFGELRSNHFHSGVDLKTQGKTGLDIHASAEGYVSRIKIAHGGYGKALYIKHPNGYTTVYAHLKKFSPKIEAYVKEKQYAKESFTIQLYPKKTELPVAKDEVVALSGNTGGSGGPHLHYEIRDEHSRPMNPMLFGMEIADKRKPLVNTVWLYPLSENAHINGSNEPYRLKINKLEDGSLKANPVFACGQIGVGVSTFDQQDGANNKNGVFKIKSAVNGNDNFELKMNRFSFSETRYLNRMIDFAYFKKNKSRITKLFIEENNPLSIYDKSKGDGSITVVDQLNYTINVSIEDLKENSKKIIIPVEGKIEPVVKEIETNLMFVATPDKDFTYEGEFAKVIIPKKALYETVALQIEELPNNFLKIHENTVPLHKYMNVSFSLKGYDRPKQCYVASFDDEAFPLYEGAKIEGAKISARTRSFGKYGVFMDSIRPVIKPVNFSNKKWISNNKTLKLFVEDKQTGIANYKATINDRFALMEYDYKKNTLFYDFEDGISLPGENKLKLYVEDKVGNTNIYEATFFRK